MLKEYPKNNNYLVSENGEIFSKRFNKKLTPKVKMGIGVLSKTVTTIPKGSTSPIDTAVEAVRSENRQEIVYSTWMVNTWDCANTDGILVKLNDYNDYELIDDTVYEWEQRTGLKMEFDEFERVYQKDVNNYVMVAKDGSYKSKGAYVKKLNKLDYELPIVNKAIINKLVHNLDIEKTINECDELKQFQMIVKASSKYAGLWYGENKLNEKCVRAFASVNKTDKGLFKRKSAHATSEKVAGTPDNCFIVNDNIEGIKISSKLDKQWYIDLASKRLEAFGI